MSPAQEQTAERDTPFSVPKLSPDGSNWVTFKTRFLFTMGGRDVEGHFDGSEKAPTQPAFSSPDEKRWTTADKELNTEYLVSARKWQRDEKVARAQLAQVVLDSLLIRIQHAKSTTDMWGAVVAEFDKKGHMVQVDLRRKMMEKRAMDADDIRAHLDEMALMHERLSGMGVAMHNDDYASMILMSLPESYTMHLETLADAASSSGNPLSAHSFIMKAIDLYEKHRLRAERDPKAAGKDSAFQTSDSKRKGKKNGQKSRRDVECYNCHKKGHFSRDCYGPGGTKEGQGPRSKNGGHKTKEGSANATNDAPDGAWSAMIAGAGPSDATFDDEDTYLEEVNEESDHIEATALHRLAPQPSDTDATYIAQSGSPADTHTPELYDSGATRHMTPLGRSLLNYRSINPKPISAANQRTFSTIGRGDLKIRVPNGDTHSNILLKDVLHTPDIALTLVSVGLISDAGYAVLFKDGTCTIRDKSNTVVGQFPKQDGLYKVDRREHPSTSAHTASDGLTIMAAHRRLGHISPEAVRALTRGDTITGLDVDMSSLPLPCDSCTYAKMMRKPLPKQRTGQRATRFGGEVHTDVWGPSPIKSLGGRSYYISFTNDKTRYTRLHLLSRKSDAFEAYLGFEAWAGTHHHARIAILRSDRGGEYLSGAFSAHLAKQGTERRLTVHDTPQENGVAEWLNRTLLERVRAMLHATQLPKGLWGEVLMHAVWLKNRTLTRALEHTTPHEALIGAKPDLAAAR